MALPVLNFSGYSTSSMKPIDLMKALQGGMQTAAMPKRLDAEQQQMDLANSLKKNELQYAPQMSQAELAYRQAQTPFIQSQTGLNNQQTEYYAPNIMSEIALREAQAKETNAKARLPFGGANLPGVGGDILGMESIRQMYGDDSPQYGMAKRQFELGQQNMQSRIGYQDSLSQSMPMRYLTPTGKGYIEQANVAQGNAPTGQPWEQQINPGAMTQALMQRQNNQGMQQQIPQQQSQMSMMPQQNMQQYPMQQQGSPLAPGSPEELTNQYEMKRFKDNTDDDTRKRNRFVTNVEKTIKNINSDDLTHFSGITGHLKLSGEQAKDAAGLPTSKEYQGFKQALLASEFLSTQVRQFYGDSIQPEMIKRLERLTNPSSWSNSPKTAKDLFNTTIKILKQEGGTYRDAAKGTSVYKDEEVIQKPNQGMPGMVTVQSPSGQILNVPADKVEMLLADHPDHKRVG